MNRATHPLALDDRSAKSCHCPRWLAALSIWERQERWCTIVRKIPPPETETGSFLCQYTAAAANRATHPVVPDNHPAIRPVSSPGIARSGYPPSGVGQQTSQSPAIACGRWPQNPAPDQPERDLFMSVYSGSSEPGYPPNGAGQAPSHQARIITGHCPVGLPTQWCWSTDQPKSRHWPPALRA